MPSVASIDNSQSDPSAFVDSVGEDVRSGASLTLRVGHEECEVSGDLASAVLRALEVLSQGESFRVQQLPETITTGQAADLLGVSRPTVIKLIEDGHIPATRIGTHRRLRTADVLGYIEESKLRTAKELDRLVQQSTKLGLYDK